ELREILPPDDIPSIEEMQDLGEELKDEILDRAEDRYEQLEQTVGEENMRKVEHWLLLETIDFHWREHLTAVEDLRQSIGLQAYAQVDPLVAFKREGYDMFQQLQDNIRRQVARTVFKVRVEQVPSRPQQAAQPQPAPNGQQGGPVPAPQAQPVLASSSAPDVSQLRTNRGEGPAPAAKPARAATASQPKIG